MDINVFNIETGMQAKVCGNHEVIRDELNPLPFYFQGKFGILFESQENGNKVIRWVNAKNKKEVILVDLPGNDFLY